MVVAGAVRMMGLQTKGEVRRENKVFGRRAVAETDPFGEVLHSVPILQRNPDVLRFQRIEES